VVNSPLAEFAPGISPDGRTLYFTRMRRGADRNAVEERLYEVSLQSLGIGR